MQYLSLRHCTVQISLHATPREWMLGAKMLGAISVIEALPHATALFCMQHPQNGCWVQNARRVCMVQYLSRGDCKCTQHFACSILRVVTGPCKSTQPFAS